MSVRHKLFGAWDRSEQRAITEVPWDTGGVLSATTITQERALALAPVFAATRIIAGTVSTLPLKGYRRLGDERLPMGTLPQLFQLLADEGKLVSWLHRMMVSLVIRGNAYGLVTARDGFGFPIVIEWLNPSDVYVDDSQSVTRPVWTWKGRVIPNEDIVHIPWFTTPGKVDALSPIAAFALTISTGLNAQTYGNEWFEGGGFPPGTFRNTSTKNVPQPDADVIKARLVSAIQSRRPLVFGSEWEYTPITVPPSEAQFIETMRLSATQIANIYGLAPEDIGGMRGNSQTYSTVELNQLERVLAVRPWLVVVEHVFASLLPERQYVRFNVDAIVRADIKTRWDVHKIAVEMGARSIDDVRRAEDEAPLPGGKGADYITPAIKAAQAPPPPIAAREGQGPNGERIWSVPA